VQALGLGGAFVWGLLLLLFLVSGFFCCWESLFIFFYLFIIYFEAGSHHVTQASLKFTILLPQPPE
jgi:hypothetical protein